MARLRYFVALIIVSLSMVLNLFWLEAYADVNPYNPNTQNQTNTQTNQNQSGFSAKADKLTPKVLQSLGKSPFDKWGGKNAQEFGDDGSSGDSAGFNQGLNFESDNSD